MNFFKKDTISKQFISMLVVVHTGLLILTVSVFSYHHYSTKKESAEHVAKVVEAMLISGQYRDVIYSLSNAKLGSFEAIGYYSGDNKRIFVLPTDKEPDYFKEKRNLLDHILNSFLEVDVYFNDTTKNKAGTLYFSFGNLSAVLWGLGIWILGSIFLIPVFHRYKKLIVDGHQKDILAEKNNVIKETVRQVWHDLGQPMQFLYALAESGKNIGDDERQKIYSTCNDMKSILDDLKEKREKIEGTNESSVCLAGALSEIVEKEKLRYIKEGHDIQLEVTNSGQDAFSTINESDLKRMMRNIINNAVLASGVDKPIRVKLSKNENNCVIEVIDQGTGIKEEHLSQIGVRGKSFRENGNGFGLSDATSKIESWGGQLEIKSKFNQGTIIQINLKADEVPSWYTGNINIDGVTDFVLVDDRPLNHTLVKDLLKKKNYTRENHFFKSTKSFEADLSEKIEELKSPLFLIDYDMGEAMNGIELIQKHDLADKALLFTNYYDDPYVQLSAMNSNIKILPKFVVK